MTAANGGAAKRGCHSRCYEILDDLICENKNLRLEKESLDILKKKQVSSARRNSSNVSYTHNVPIPHIRLSGLECCKYTGRIYAVSWRSAGTSEEIARRGPYRSRAIGETTVRKEAPQSSMVSQEVEHVMFGHPLMRFSSKTSKSISEEHAKINTLLDDQIAKLEKDLAAAETKKDEFTEDAERIAPKEQWLDRLDRQPTSNSNYSKAIHKCEQNILSIKLSRRMKKGDIVELQSSIESLFEDETVSADAEEDPAHAEDCSETESASPKKRKFPSKESREKRNLSLSRVSMGSTQEDGEGDEEEEEEEQLTQEVAKKSRKQRSIASFFGKST